MPAKKNADQIVVNEETATTEAPKKRRTVKSKAAENDSEQPQLDPVSMDESKAAPKKRRTSRSDASEKSQNDETLQSDIDTQPAKRRASRKKTEISDGSSDTSTPQVNNADDDLIHAKNNHQSETTLVDRSVSIESSDIPTDSQQSDYTQDNDIAATSPKQQENVQSAAPKNVLRNRFLNLFTPQTNEVASPTEKPTAFARSTITVSEDDQSLETNQSAEQDSSTASLRVEALQEVTPINNTPFVPKVLARPKRVWFGSTRFPTLESCKPDPNTVVQSDPRPKPLLSMPAEAAMMIQEIGMRKGRLPSCPSDCSPTVLDNIRNLSRTRFIRPRKQTAVSAITFDKKRKLYDLINETMPPLHIASSLVGGDYAYEDPNGVQLAAEQQQQPVTMTLGELQAAMTNSGPVTNNQPPQTDPYEFFKFFDTPIQVFDYSDKLSNAAQSTLQYQHTVNHCSNIIQLLKVWASQMALVDMDLKRPSDNVPITQLFYKRFLKTLQSDFNTAYELGVYLPDMRLANRFDLNDTDLFILWTIAALQIDPDFREHLVPTWTLGSVIVMSAAVIMRFVANNQDQRSDLLYRMSPSGPLQTKGLLRSTYARSPTMPLYYELTVPEQLSLQFAGTQSLSTPTSEYATLCHPSLSSNTYIAPENEFALNIIRNYTTRPLLNSAKELNQQNLNIIPSLPFFIEGLPGSGRTTLMKIIASKLNKPMIVVNCAQLVMLSPDDLSAYFIELFHDALMLDALVTLKDASLVLAEARYVPIITRHLSNFAVVCAFCVDLKQAVTPEMEPFVTFKTKMASNLKENAVSVWKQHLGNLPMVNTKNVDMLDLSRSLALQPFQIQKATRLAYYASDASSEDIFDPEAVPLSNSQLHRAASSQVAKNIGTLAFISDPEVTLDDVIVSDEIMSKIKQIIGSAKNRRRVLYEWGLSKRIRRGTGVICLFDGEPGTGKTHSAEAIAQTLGLQLMRVNIASMVDKYIGETEKNLTKIFEQARPDMSLLLFDEADSLFTKRTSNVSKSNDRYSNMSVNVLLQLVERYEGVSVLTTNLKNSIDPAFERRITYKIYFGMPKKEERIRLWKYMCPPDVLTAEPLDYEWLGELEMSGGEIKNAVLAGAFRAATMGKLLDTEFLYDAGVTEATAAGRVLRHYGENDDGFN